MKLRDVQRLIDRKERLLALEAQHPEVGMRQLLAILRRVKGIQHQIDEFWRRWDESLVQRWAFAPPREVADESPVWCRSLIVSETWEWKVVMGAATWLLVGRRTSECLCCVDGAGSSASAMRWRQVSGFPAADQRLGEKPNGEGVAAW